MGQGTLAWESSERLLVGGVLGVDGGMILGVLVDSVCRTGFGKNRACKGTCDDKNEELFHWKSPLRPARPDQDGFRLVILTTLVVLM